MRIRADVADEPSERRRPRIYADLKSQQRPEHHDGEPVLLELLTDPWSVWCWGFEPVRRAIQARYPTIRFRTLVGGMFPHMPDPEELPFDLDAFFAQVNRNTGMPTSTPVVRGHDRPDSTYPACIHWHAARIAEPDLADTYLRALREAVYLDGQNASDPEVAIEVARRIGIDADHYGKILESGQPELEFEKVMESLQERNLYAYPTILLTHGGRTGRIEGFQNLPAVLGAAKTLTGTVHAPTPDPALDDVLDAKERITTREVAEVLGMGMERTYDRLAKAEADGRVERHRFPQADAWTLVQK